MFSLLACEQPALVMQCLKMEIQNARLKKGYLKMNAVDLGDMNHSKKIPISFRPVCCC